MRAEAGEPIRGLPMTRGSARRRVASSYPGSATTFVGFEPTVGKTVRLEHTA